MLQYLQPHPRKKDMTQVLEEMTVAFQTQPVPEWGRALDEADFPHVYFGTFGAIVANVVCLIFPGMISGPLIKVLGKVFIGDKDSLDFLT